MTQPLPSWIPDGVDITTPTAARIYDYALGGFHNFQVDRDLAEEAQRSWPDFFRVAHEHRAFLGRAIQWLLDHGVRQFLDLGSGLPGRGGVPELLQHTAVDTRAVHVDLDPLVVAHNTHLIDGRKGVRAIQGDIRDPELILRHPEVDEVLDLAEPVAVVATGVLQFVADADDPAGIIRHLSDATVAGSYLVLSHATPTTEAAEQQDRVRQLFDRTPTPLRYRSPEQIAGLPAGWTLVDPGLVPVTTWHPDPDDEPEPAQPAILAAVAHKPPRPRRRGDGQQAPPERKDANR
jgi:hypothetical protein